MNIQKVTKENYQELINVWEASVRATHKFLSEGKIAELKLLILEQYFDAVDLRCFKDSNDKILAFIGVADSKIEMLFVDPDYIGQKIGRKLTKYAIENLGASKVDVNEQNPNAIGFYQRMGFVQSGRSVLDGEGNPFPLIHMKLKKI
ncbi:GNAT family N-acetyltransferase [Halarcobacter mediterraneus]|uniref:GNAT family N-acetyltransferase n=1 Tax=Halarcobacter mediterraneus TaxID=2023153 RepID=A0A4Q1AWZ4_9BACT|nr:GNAT family N-acetyltransferase [Halarcobacter mediterraneus]RXK14605.1 GNAT family N-acetyltransferase [Halarcobacter mediterraneus]